MIFYLVTAKKYLIIFVVVTQIYSAAINNLFRQCDHSELKSITNTSNSNQFREHQYTNRPLKELLSCNEIKLTD